MPIDYYKEMVHFKVIASDGYSEAEDFFSLNASGIPISYIIE